MGPWLSGRRRPRGIRRLAVLGAGDQGRREEGRRPRRAGVGAASVDAQIRQARFDRFLSRVFAEGERSEWLLKGGMSMLARVPRSRTTKDVDLAALRASDLAEAERALAALAEADLGDHLTFRLIRSTPTGLGENQPGVATRRYVFACIDSDHDTQVDTVLSMSSSGRRRRTSRSGRASEPAAPAPGADHLPLPPLPGRRPDRRQSLRDDGHSIPRRQAQQSRRNLSNLVLIAHTRPPTSTSFGQPSPPSETSATSGHSSTSTSPPNGPDLPSDRERRPSGRVLHRADRSRPRGILRRPALGKHPKRATWNPQALAWIPDKSNQTTAPGGT